MTMRLTIDEQVDCVVRLMATGQWRGAASSKALAEEWQVHPRTVGDRAVVASGILKRTGSPIEEWVLGKLAELEEIKATAMRLQKPIVHEGVVTDLVDAPDVKAAILAVRTQLEIRGQLTKKVEVSKVPSEYLEQTPEQRIVAHEAAIAEERARLAGGMH